MRFSLNRKASWRGWLMALLFLGLTVPLSGKEPQWIFNNGPDIADVAIGQGNLFSEVGLMTIKSTGTDMTVTNTRFLRCGTKLYRNRNLAGCSLQPTN